MTVSIGSVVLRAFEVPSVVHYGTSQRVAIHRLGNGSRVVDCLGPDPLDISFSGTLTGTDADMRASVLKTFCESGQDVPLSWGTSYYQVIVRQFTTRYMSPVWIEYDLTCTVTDPPVSSTTSTGVDFLQIGSDLQIAGQFGTRWEEDLLTVLDDLLPPSPTMHLNSAYDRLLAIQAEVQSCTDDCRQAFPIGVRGLMSDPEAGAKLAMFRAYLYRATTLVRAGVAE